MIRVFEKIGEDGEVDRIAVIDNSDPPEGYVEVDPTPFLPRAPSYRQLRAAAYRDEMGAEAGNFIVTIGDVLDDIFEWIATFPAEQRTARVNELLAKRAAIKARYPKP